LILTTAACSYQNEPVAEADPVHPILRWIGIGLLVILALVIAIYMLFQIYEGLVQRDLSYSLGGVLGFITGLIIGGLIDRENGTWTILALPGMYIGDYFIKIKIQARGLIAFVIGFLWLGVFIVFIGAMILVIQENTTWF
jgi:hypothetical protein